MSTKHRNRPLPRETLATNLRWLMKHSEHNSQRKVAEAAGISQSAVKKVLKKDSSATLGTVDAIARVWGLTMWHLIMPNLPDDLRNTDSIGNLFNAFARATPEGREHILSVASREAKYASSQPDSPDDDPDDGSPPVRKHGT